MEQESKKIIAVVVTHNRKELLNKCIESLLRQDYSKFEILIVDNASNDGTEESIQQYIKDKKVQYINTGSNLGGAGGFNYGMKKAIELGFDYIWIMDDDTIPYKNALEELIKADQVLEGKYGFLSSTALWEDGTPCIMNRQKITKDWYNYSQYLRQGLLKTYYATFVSFFIKTSVVKDIGLPIKEFFIWGDDVEYSNRISKKYDCFIVGKSQVLHKTMNNVGSNIAKDDEKRIGRYKYAYRNEVYIARKNGLKGICRQFAKIILHIFRVITKSKKAKLKKTCIILINSFKGIFFNPKIEYIENGDNR